jgi:hypothetical protein
MGQGTPLATYDPDRRCAPDEGCDPCKATKVRP